MSWHGRQPFCTQRMLKGIQRPFRTKGKSIEVTHFNQTGRALAFHNSWGDNTVFCQGTSKFCKPLWLGLLDTVNSGSFYLNINITGNVYCSTRLISVKQRQQEDRVVNLERQLRRQELQPINIKKKSLDVSWQCDDEKNYLNTIETFCPYSTWSHVIYYCTNLILNQDSHYCTVITHHAISAFRSSQNQSRVRHVITQVNMCSSAENTPSFL